MTPYEQRGHALPSETAARKARVARLARRVLAVPFWGLLALFLVSWPAGVVYPVTGWHLARFLSTVLLVPVTLIRALPTTRVLGFSHYQNAHLRRRPGCLVGFGLVAGVLLLYWAATFLAPALVPTTAVNATVTACHLDKGGPEPGTTRSCTGDWTVDGVRETARGLPVTGPPGSTVRINVSQLDAGTAYGRLSGSRESMGVALAVGGALAAGLSLSPVIASRDRIRRGLDDVIAGRATVPARVLGRSSQRG